MVNKGLVCSILLGILLILVTTIQITLDNFLSNIHQKVESIDYAIAEHKNNLNDVDVLKKFDELQNLWEDNIAQMCLILNYKDIASVGEAISRLQAGIEANEFSNCNTETKQLLKMIGALQKIFGIRLPNIL